MTRKKVVLNKIAINELLQFKKDLEAEMEKVSNQTQIPAELYSKLQKALKILEKAIETKEWNSEYTEFLLTTVKEFDEFREKVKV